MKTNINIHYNIERKFNVMVSAHFKNMVTDEEIDQAIRLLEKAKIDRKERIESQKHSFETKEKRH